MSSSPNVNRRSVVLVVNGVTHTCALYPKTMIRLFLNFVDFGRNSAGHNIFDCLSVHVEKLSPPIPCKNTTLLQCQHCSKSEGP
jgi:hypothetical protein